MKELIKKIEHWAIDREIHKKGTVEGQSIKTAEEIAELIKGISKDDMDLIKDSIGDVFVTLVVGNMISENLDLEEHYNEAKRDFGVYSKQGKKKEIDFLAQTITYIISDGYYEDTLFFGLTSLLAIVDMYNLDFKDCVESAYDEIANRKGRMINGTFVKPEDLYRCGEVDEAVEHPKHYNQGSIEAIDAIEDWELNFNLGNVIKYIARCEHKGNKLVDLEKAMFYLVREVENNRENNNSKDIKY